MGNDEGTVDNHDSALEHADDITRSVREHYDRLVHPYTEAFFDDVSDAPWLDRLLDHLYPSARVLDIGCGPGRLSRYMVDRGYNVTGIDLSPGMIAIACRLVPEATFAVMDMSALSYPDASFDGLFSAYSLMHLPPSRVDPALSEFRRVLAPGGLIGFIIKQGDGTRVEASPLLHGESCWVQLWDERAFTGRLHAHGFEVVDQDTASPDSPEELPFERLLFLARSIDST